MATSTTSKECGAAFMIGTVTAVCCISETAGVAAATSTGGAGDGANIGMILALGAAGVGLLGI